MSNPKLYTYKESGNCYKVSLLAALLDIKLEEVELDYMNGEHHSDKFMALNPRGQLP
jgi:glutathione S-transferase